MGGRYKESSASSRKQMDRAGLEAGLHCLLLAWDKVSSSITDVKMILLVGEREGRPHHTKRQTG